MAEAAILERLTGVVIGGQYRLERHITTTGMSVVYRAFDNQNRVYAVKILIEVGLLARFIREAQLGAAMDHPHVVRTLISRIDPPEIVLPPMLSDEVALRYIVMPWIPGESLRDIARRRAYSDGAFLSTPRALEEARSVLLPIADALYDLHTKKRFVHRDIKPSNILFVESDQAPYLIDLGIAREIEDPDATNIGPPRENLTRVGEIVGTNRYMPPEQFVTSMVTEAADQYALAITIYELLTNGKSPYEEAMREFNIDPRAPRTNTNENEQWHRIHLRFAPTPLTDHRRDLPPEVWSVLKRALEKKPHERFPSIQAFAQAFADATNWTGYAGGANLPVNLPPRASTPSNVYTTPPSAGYPSSQITPPPKTPVYGTPTPPTAPPTTSPPTSPPPAENPAFLSTREGRDVIVIVVMIVLALAVILGLILVRSINSTGEFAAPPTSSSLQIGGVFSATPRTEIPTLTPIPTFTPNAAAMAEVTDDTAPVSALITDEATTEVTIEVTPTETATFTVTFTPTLSPQEENTLLAQTAIAAGAAEDAATGTQSAFLTETVAPTETQYAIETLVAEQLTNIAQSWTPTNTTAPMNTPAPTETFTATATDTPIPTDVPMQTDTATATATDTPTETDTPTLTATHTATITLVPTTAAPTDTPIPTDRVTTASSIRSTELPTFTPTLKPTLTPTDTATFTPTPTDTLTFTPTPTDTPTPTFTPTPTNTPTSTFTPTATYTATNTPTPTFTSTPDVSLLLAAGARLQGQGDYIGALAPLDRALALEPRNSLVLLSRGESYLQLCYALPSRTNANCEAARENFEAVLRLADAPEAAHVLALTGRGRVYTAIERYDDAAAAFDAALAIDRNAAVVYVHYAELLLAQDNTADAVRYLNAALRLDAQNANAYLQLGEARFARGEYELAREAYRQYVALSGIEPSPRLQARLDELDSLLAGR